LAVAERRGDASTLSQFARTARSAGLGLDEVARARAFSSQDEKEAALLALLRETLDHDQRPPHHLVEEAREAGWTDAEIIDAVAEVALVEFQSLIASAAALPLEGSDPAVLRSAA
jgi:hypothetical protein